MFLWFKAMNYYVRARISSRRGLHNQAIANFDQAIKLMPSSAGYQGRGVAYALSGQPDQAILDYNQALKLEPNNARTYGVRAEAHAILENYDQGITDWSQAIKLNPNLAGAYRGRAVIYWIKGDYEKAANDIRKAKSLGCKIPSELNNFFREIEKSGPLNQSKGEETQKPVYRNEKQGGEISQPEDFKTGSEPDGFKDIKWGTDISTLPDMEYQRIDSGFKNTRLYIKKNDELKIGAAVLKSISYGFRGDKFYNVRIIIEGYTRWISLKEVIFEKFGEGRPTRMQYSNEYCWSGKTTLIMLGYDDILESGEFMMVSAELHSQRGEG